jgi:hypothetical protein
LPGGQPAQKKLAASAAASAASLAGREADASGRSGNAQTRLTQPPPPTGEGCVPLGHGTAPFTHCEGSDAPFVRVVEPAPHSAQPARDAPPVALR